MELIGRFPLVPIRNAAQLQAAHAMIDELVRTPEHKLTLGQDQYLEVLGDLTSKYEDALMDRELADTTGLETLKHLIEASDMQQMELANILGVGNAAVSMILSGERKITADHARKLGQRFAVKPGLFL